MIFISRRMTLSRVLALPVILIRSTETCGPVRSRGQVDGFGSVIDPTEGRDVGIA